MALQSRHGFHGAVRDLDDTDAAAVVANESGLAGLVVRHRRTPGARLHGRHHPGRRRAVQEDGFVAATAEQCCIGSIEDNLGDTTLVGCEGV